jgi:integrase/recombinase XerD
MNSPNFTSGELLMDSTKILTKNEIKTVLAELHRKRRSVNTRQNRVIFTLSCLCGLRVSEIVGITLQNVKVDSDRPHIVIPSGIAKRKKSRKIPLWWDYFTLNVLKDWKAERISKQNAGLSDYFVCSQTQSKRGKPLSRRNAQARWSNALKSLPSERRSGLSIHAGRHSYGSHALAGGRTLVEVRDSMGHTNISVTSIYLHCTYDDDDKIGNLFNLASDNVSG